MAQPTVFCFESNDCGGVIFRVVDNGTICCGSDGSSHVPADASGGCTPCVTGKRYIFFHS